VRINRLAPEGVNLYAKVEAFNPLGSVKDRLALGIIEDAEQRGTGMVRKAEALAKKHGWFLTRQFENEANADMHARTTAREIMNDFEGMKLDAFVTGYGTGGTLKGVGRVLRKESPGTRIIVCEPAIAALMKSGEAQPRRDDGVPTASHAAWEPHPIQGWTPDFIPKLAEDAREAKYVDEYMTVAPPEAMKWSRELASKEGLFVGVSAGGTFACAREYAGKAQKGANILCMLPDTGERYLSTPLFEPFVADMNAEEQELANSVD
jgi:cysteine synthase